MSWLVAAAAAAAIAAGAALVSLVVATPASAQGLPLPCPIELPSVRPGESLVVPTTGLTPGSTVRIGGDVSHTFTVPADSSPVELQVPANLAAGSHSLTIAGTFSGVPVQLQCVLTVEAAQAGAPPAAGAAAPQSQPAEAAPTGGQLASTAPNEAPAELQTGALQSAPGAQILPRTGATARDTAGQAARVAAIGAALVCVAAFAKQRPLRPTTHT